MRPRRGSNPRIVADDYLRPPASPLAQTSSPLGSPRGQPSPLGSPQVVLRRASEPEPRAPSEHRGSMLLEADELYERAVSSRPMVKRERIFESLASGKDEVDLQTDEVRHRAAMGRRIERSTRQCLTQAALVFLTKPFPGSGDDGAHSRGERG